MRLAAETFTRFQKYLVDQAGLFFDPERASFLESKLAERTSKLKIDSFDDYLHYLQFNPQGTFEMRGLLDTLTIGETFFFRNEAQFEVLKNYVFPSLFEKRRLKDARSGHATEKYPLKIWCAGCSTGEEPYSVAILLKETLPAFDSWDISLIATDINQKSLAASEKGEYKQRAVNLVPPGIMDKYFVRRGSSYLVNDEIKKMVRFCYHNLASDPYTLEGMQDVDIIFCRNVTIYFDSNTLKQVIAKMAACLVTDGFLFIGHSETLWGISQAFKAVEFPNTFIYQKLARPEAGVAEMPHIPLPTLPEMEQATVEMPSEEITITEPSFAPEDLFVPYEENKAPSAPEIEVEEEVEAVGIDAGLRAFQKKDYAKARRIMKAHIGRYPNDIKAMMMLATVDANEGAYDEAVLNLNNVISRDNINVPAYYLLGVIYSKQGDYANAIESFRKMLYSDEKLSIGYFHLANIYRFLGKREDAMREYRNCLKLLKGQKDDAAVALAEDLSAGLLYQAVQGAMRALSPQDEVSS